MYWWYMLVLSALRLKLNEWIRCLAESPAILRLLTSTICVWFATIYTHFFLFVLCICVIYLCGCLCVCVCGKSCGMPFGRPHMCLTSFLFLWFSCGYSSSSSYATKQAKNGNIVTSRYSPYIYIYLHLYIFFKYICVYLHSTWTTMTAKMRSRRRRWGQQKVE